MDKERIVWGQFESAGGAARVEKCVTEEKASVTPSASGKCTSSHLALWAPLWRV